MPYSIMDSMSYKHRQWYVLLQCQLLGADPFPLPSILHPSWMCWVMHCTKARIALRRMPRL